MRKSFVRAIAMLAVFLCLISVDIRGYVAFAADLEQKISQRKDQLPQVSEKVNLPADLKVPSREDVIVEPLVTLQPQLPIYPGRPILPPNPDEELPAAYCMRDDYIIFAQHQDKNGLCWNFAATMAASTTIMKATNEYYDFSELWTAITCYTPKKQYSTVCGGGNFSYHYKALQRSGLVLESDLPYQYSYTVSNENAVDYYNFHNKYANDDLSASLLYDNDLSYRTSDIEAIKRHILENGSLYLGFTFRTGFEKSDGVYSLAPNQKNTTSNHAVALIGWDDNFEKEFYLDGSDTPTVFKGAWIVLNSYTETNGEDGISLIFYEDDNIYNIKGYLYEKDTNRPLYFYDKIESGYAYPTNVKGKYYGDLVAETAPTKQLNIFYDDVALEYSYEIAPGASISGIEIYLDNKDVTDDFAVRIDEKEKRFYISREDAAYGNYKVLVRYGNAQTSDTYLNNFYVTHGLVGEELEFNYEANNLGFNTGKDLEYYSYMSSDKDYVIYTKSLSGSISFLPIEQSVYSEKNMSVPSISYEITDGKSCTVTHTVEAASGYLLEYRFTFIYCDDTTMQTVRVFYDLAGGENHGENYMMELGNEGSGLLLYEPSREGYTFAGWYVMLGDGSTVTEKSGEGYVIPWDTIHHMGESPTVYASSYYKKYYKNTNILFVRAIWEPVKYSIAWENYDGTLLYEGTYTFGEAPVYAGPTPTRAEDARYTYTFACWTTLGDGTAYTASFNAIPKQYTVSVLPGENGTVVSSATGAITCLESRFYTFTPDEGYRVKDVTVNGVSVGALTSYTLSDVCEDQSIAVTFEKESVSFFDRIVAFFERLFGMFKDM